MHSSPSSEQSIYERNVTAIADFYRSGIKSGPGKIGIELEHFIVHADTGLPVTYSEEHGVAWILEKLNETYPRASYDGDHDLVGVSRLNGSVMEAITIEPAAQLELSAGPFSTLDEANECYTNFEDALESILAPVGEAVDRIGYLRHVQAADTELIPKQRYNFMNRYLGGKSAWGPRMMRGTTSTQISVDYSSEEDCLRKFKLACRLVPIISLICDNSPYFEGKARTHHMMRTEVWQHCDPDRCNLVPGALEDDFTLEDYARYVLGTPAILVPDGSSSWRFDDRPFKDIYAEVPMERSDVEHAVSMQFNDIRIKTYIEIRPADAMPVEYVMAYAALIKGVFENESALCAAEELCSAAVNNQDVEQAKLDLMDAGYQARVYGIDVGQFADRLIDIARAGIGKAEAAYLEPLAKLVSDRTTLAQRAIDAGN